jgi:hypothetical protein
VKVEQCHGIDSCFSFTAITSDTSLARKLSAIGCLAFFTLGISRMSYGELESVYILILADLFDGKYLTSFMLREDMKSVLILRTSRQNNISFFFFQKYLTSTA